MMKINIIHFIEGSGRLLWLEKLMEVLDSKGFTQALLTVDAPGENHDYLAKKFPEMKINKNAMRRIPSIRWIYQVRDMRVNGSLNIILPLGHPASFISAISALFLRVHFVLCHTQQPRYFEVMSKQAPLRVKFHQMAYKFYIRRADTVISLSKEVEEVLVSHGVDNGKITPINFGIDFEKIRRQLNELVSAPANMKEVQKILMVGRLATEKNYLVALEAFAIFLQTYPNAILSIAGEGPQREEISDFARTLHVSDNIRFLGYVKNIPRLMTEFDLLLHIASTESYGQIYLEALLSGLPIICSRTGVAIDLSEVQEPNIRVVVPQSVQSISKELLNFFAQSTPLLNSEMDLFAHLYKHEDNFVYQEIALFFKTLGTNRKGA